jgi:hypothetical protein
MVDGELRVEHGRVILDIVDWSRTHQQLHREDLEDECAAFRWRRWLRTASEPEDLPGSCFQTPIRALVMMATANHRRYHIDTWSPNRAA